MKQSQHSANDVYGFLRAWLANPLRVASITPSGKSLATLITCEISSATGPVIELGPGTGVFTRALVRQGVAPSDLTLIEAGPEFAALLQRRFPQARVLQMDAARLRRVELFSEARAGAVVSGLPLLSMSPRKIMAILEGAFVHLRAGGSFYQFTYGPRCPVPRALLEHLGLKATRLGIVYANIPPASVYRIQRRGRRRARPSA